MLALLAWLLAFLVFASAAYCLIVVGAARSYLRDRAKVRPAADGALPPMSILKPLAGADEGIEENLRSFFTQDYPDFEILFAVRDESDAAVDIVGQLQKEYPQVPSRLIVTGEPPYPNAKVYSLQKMIAAARHELLAMSDSDVRVTPDFLRVAAAEFRNPKLGMTTCPYRAVPGGSFWSRLEAVGMNTEFLGGVLAARLIEGVKFALGPTIIVRRKVLGAIGGIERFRDYLAEDFVLGKFAAEAGFGVELSGYIIEHRIGSQPFAVNMRHRLRWARSTRRSRPSGYAGQIFTHPLPFAVGLLACSPILWPLALTALVLRALAAWAVAGWVLHDSLCRRHWYLIPLQDFLSFGFWIAGFFGNYISWRGRRYYLRSDGRFELVDS